MTRPGPLHDVVISGAGMVGATAACLFARSGLKVALLDDQAISPARPSPNPALYGRVSAINIASSNLFAALGVWDSITGKRVSPYRCMRVWENNSDVELSFNALAMRQRQLGFIVENSAILSSLIEKLRQNYNVRLFENTRLRERQVEADKLTLFTDTNQTLQCKLLLGADGAQSRVREISGIDSQVFDYQQSAIVTRVTTEQPHQATAWQAFLPTGPVALLPLRDGASSVVWSCDNPFANHVMAMSDAQFCDTLGSCFARHVGAVTSCEKRSKFPLVQQHASAYIAKRTALCGDAAHTTHPLAGLGANLGFMDAAAIAEVTEAARDRNIDIGNHSVLRRYERWRKGENTLVLETMKGLKTLFGQEQKVFRVARQTGLGLVDRATPLKNRMAGFAMGLSGDLPEICRSANHSPHGSHHSPLEGESKKPSASAG